MSFGPDRYCELAPASAARGLLTCVWSRTTGAGGPRLQRVVPDGCVDIIWHRDASHLFIAGPDTHAHVSPSHPGTLVGVRFWPGTSPIGVGLPANELRDGRVVLDDVWEASRVRRLSDRLAEAGSIADAQRVLTEEVVAGVDGRPDRMVPEVVRLLLDAGSGEVAAVADRVGLSERQLHRRCVAAFGYGPKVLQRVLRFDRAVRLARRGDGFAEVAYRVGYADQAHLAREVKGLAGVSLGVLLGGVPGSDDRLRVVA